jgi:hypothetical protein
MNGTLHKIGIAASALFTGIIGLAILAVVLSNGSSTVTVIQDFFSGLTSLITQVVTPVQGGSNLALGGATSNSGVASNDTSSGSSILSGFGGSSSSSGGTSSELGTALQLYSEFG